MTFVADYFLVRTENEAEFAQTGGLGLRSISTLSISNGRRPLSAHTGGVTVRLSALCILVAAVSACSATMQPIESDTDRFRFQYFQPEFDRALQGAKAQCAKLGKSAEVESTECNRKRFRDPACLGVSTCERCDSWFKCVAAPQQAPSSFADDYSSGY